jgi:hypothetical protein
MYPQLERLSVRRTLPPGRYGVGFYCGAMSQASKKGDTDEKHEQDCCKRRRGRGRFGAWWPDPARGGTNEPGLFDDARLFSASGGNVLDSRLRQRQRKQRLLGSVQEREPSQQQQRPGTGAAADFAPQPRAPSLICRRPVSDGLCVGAGLRPAPTYLAASVGGFSNPPLSPL